MWVGVFPKSSIAPIFSSRSVLWVGSQRYSEPARSLLQSHTGRESKQVSASPRRLTSRNPGPCLENRSGYAGGKSGAGWRLLLCGLVVAGRTLARRVGDDILRKQPGWNASERTLSGVRRGRFARSFPFVSNSLIQPLTMKSPGRLTAPSGNSATCARPRRQRFSRRSPVTPERTPLHGTRPRRPDRLCDRPVHQRRLDESHSR